MPKTAIVTGGTRGIGKAIVIELARSGYHMVANYHSNAAAADETRAAVEAIGGTIETLAFDVADAEQTAAAMKAIIARAESIDVLVNNAGITADNLFLMMKPGQWASVVDVALKGFYNVTKPVIKKMVRQKKRCDRHDFIRCRDNGQSGPGQLFRGQGRPDRRQQVPGSRGRTTGHSRQCGGARPDRNRNDSGCSGGRSQADDPHGTRRSTG